MPVQSPYPPIAPDRPGSVTAVAVIEIIGCAILLVVALVGLAASAALSNAALPRFMLVVSMVLCVGQMILSFYLLKGNRTARVIITVLIVISALTSLIGLNLTSIIRIVLSVVFIICLYTSRANEYFESAASYQATQARPVDHQPPIVEDEWRLPPEDPPRGPRNFPR